MKRRSPRFLLLRRSTTLPRAAAGVGKALRSLEEAQEARAAYALASPTRKTAIYVVDQQGAVPRFVEGDDLYPEAAQ